MDTDNDYSSDDDYYTTLTPAHVPFVPPNMKDSKYGIERPLQDAIKKNIAKPDASVGEWLRIYTLWQGHNIPTGLSRFDDLFVRFDTLYETGKDALLQWLKSTTNTPCVRKTQQNTFDALLRLCDIDDEECRKEYVRRLANIYYFNASEWITDNRWRFRVERSKSATGRKRNDDDLDLIQRYNLDPDLKITTPEWKSSLAQAFRKISTAKASPEELQIRVNFYKEVALLRKRAKDRRAKSKELTREKRDIIKSRKDALKPMKATKPMKARKKTKAQAQVDPDSSDAESSAEEPVHYSDEEPLLERDEYIQRMESSYGIWTGAPRNTRLTAEEKATLPDSSMPKVEYFGMVLDFLSYGDWSKENIQSIYGGDPEDTEEVAEALSRYCTFVATGMTRYYDTLDEIRREIKVTFSDAECLNWISECQRHNRRTIDELNETCEFENISASHKARIIAAMNEFILYF